MKHSIALVSLLVTLSACESSTESASAPQSAESTPAASESSASPAGESGEAKVWVARSDGSKSCETDSGRELHSDEVPLKDAGIPVYDARKGDDGLMHMQVCGADTGRQNRFLIPMSRLSDAQKLGFEAVK